MFGTVYLRRQMILALFETPVPLIRCFNSSPFSMKSNLTEAPSPCYPRYIKFLRSKENYISLAEAEVIIERIHNDKRIAKSLVKLHCIYSYGQIKQHPYLISTHN